MGNKIINNVTVGADIEFFLRDKNTQEIISAENYVKGTKDQPFRFDEKNKFYATSLDNVLVEGNIPPAKNPYQMYRYVNKLINYIKSTLPEELELLSIPSAKLDHKWLQTDNAQIAGCEVSFNAYTGEPIRATVNPEGYRGASYHIHIGYEDPNVDTNSMIARAMDLFLGIPSVILEPKNDRKLAGYGMAANMRHKPYGMEYRTLSSYFSKERKLIQWSYNNTINAIDFVNKNNGLGDLDHMGQMIEDIINTENKEMAQQLIERFNINVNV